MPTWVKLNVRPELSTEPTHFLTLMNNGKTSSSLDGIALHTVVFTGNDTFLTDNITQDGKRFITQSKHIFW